jgi:regulatory protein
MAALVGRAGVAHRPCRVCRAGSLSMINPAPDREMKITALRRQKRNGQRVNLYLDGEYRLSLPREVALRARLGVGQEIDEAGIEALRASAIAWSTREGALRLLSFRPRTRRQLQERLGARGHPTEVVERVLNDLASSGLVDDVAFARAFVRERLRTRPRGRSVLLAELRARGVSPEAASAALDDVLSEEPANELDLARRAAAKFRRRAAEPVPAADRRLYGFLARRGFSSEAIMRIIAEERL